ncbi:MAG TPA: hypothetical protein ENI62_11220 [Gammaproteobacteria bacterium]|nr:hypothetical protein [Gammaproteobacteria bacterium]
MSGKASQITPVGESPECPEWWDPWSNQPRKIAQADKPQLNRETGLEYAKVLSTALLRLPRLSTHYLRLAPTVPAPADSFIGLSISPDTRFNAALVEMIGELGVRQLLLRVPVWQLERLDEFRDFIQRFPQCSWLINILQDRNSVVHPERWQHALSTIFSALSPLVNWFQIGNAVNRSKWGCHHSGDYLQLLDHTEQLRSSFPSIKLAGSSVIDFEPLVTLRTLHNHHNYRLDAVAAQLYINRRGSAYGYQYGIFDLYNKLRLIKTIVNSGTRNQPRLWITETNWPLLHSKPFTPNSGHPRSTVNEDTQARYLQQYYRIAWQTGWVERVYWWQLINPGYGLVDHRRGRLRKMPAYFALKELSQGGLQTKIPAHAG